MKKGKKDKKKKIIVICILIVIMSFISVFARYMLNRYRDFYSRTKEFYFNSDKLGEDNPFYQIENWSGIEDYAIIVNMNSLQNNLIATTYDIAYTLSATCSSNIKCNLSKSSGVIRSSTNTDSFTIKITPDTELQAGEVVSINITAQATEPYQKTLSARFNLVIGKEKVSYEIVDSVGSPYVELSITNTLSYYTVKTAFGTYNVNDKIPRDVYMELPSADKLKCASAIIKIQFDPNIIVLDMTNENYLSATNITTAVKDTYNYINGLTFRVDSMASTKIRFYKMDISKDYTYPKQGASPVVDVQTL